MARRFLEMRLRAGIVEGEDDYVVHQEVRGYQTYALEEKVAQVSLQRDTFPACVDIWKEALLKQGLQFIILNEAGKVLANFDAKDIDD